MRARAWVSLLSCELIGNLRPSSFSTEPETRPVDTDHWTLARITAVIEQTTGARYHPGHTWKLLRRMGWRLLRPARWVAEDWP